MLEKIQNELVSSHSVGHRTGFQTRQILITNQRGNQVRALGTFSLYCTYNFLYEYFSLKKSATLTLFSSLSSYSICNSEKLQSWAGEGRTIKFCYRPVCTYVRDLFNMTMHFGNRSHAYTHYLKQPSFRVTSLMDNSFCYRMCICLMSTVRFKCRKGTKLIFKLIYMS